MQEVNYEFQRVVEKK